MQVKHAISQASVSQKSHKVSVVGVDLRGRVRKLLEQERTERGCSRSQILRDALIDRYTRKGWL